MSVPGPSFLANEGGYQHSDHYNDDVIFIDEVMDAANTAVTRELPNNYPFIVTKQYILYAVRNWDKPSRSLYMRTKDTVLTHVERLVSEHFGSFEHGGLKGRVSHIVAAHVNVHAEETLARLEFILTVEAEPFTLNRHYFLDYREKFLQYFKDLRSENTLLRPSISVQKTPSDPMEPALGIMADARAYFQVAFKRFVDSVAMMLDQSLVLGIVNGLDSAIVRGLGLNGREGFEICQKLLAEPEERHALRGQLERRKERLLSAQKELNEVFVL